MGDKIYGGNEEVYLKFIETGMDQEMELELMIARHALHASKMSVVLGGEMRHWSIDMASDMDELLIK